MSVSLLICIFSSVALRLARPAGTRTTEKPKHHWFLWVGSNVALLRPTREEKECESKRVAKMEANTVEKTHPRRTKQHLETYSFLEPKSMPKWAPEAPETCRWDGGPLERPKMRARGPPERQKRPNRGPRSAWESIGAGSTWGRRGVDVPIFGVRGP